jgi:hypothetical protein
MQRKSDGAAVEVIVGQEEMGTYTKADENGGVGKRIPWRCDELHQRLQQLTVHSLQSQLASAPLPTTNLTISNELASPHSATPHCSLYLAPASRKGEERPLPLAMGGTNRADMLPVGAEEGVAWMRLSI